MYVTFMYMWVEGDYFLFIEFSAEFCWNLVKLPTDWHQVSKHWLTPLMSFQPFITLKTKDHFLKWHTV